VYGRAKEVAFYASIVMLDTALSDIKNNLQQCTAGYFLSAFYFVDFNIPLES